MSLPTRRHYEPFFDFPSLEAAIHTALDFCQGPVTAAKEWCADRGVSYDDRVERDVFAAAKSYGEVNRS